LNNRQKDQLARRTAFAARTQLQRSSRYFSRCPCGTESRSLQIDQWRGQRSRDPPQSQQRQVCVFRTLPM